VKSYQAAFEFLCARLADRSPFTKQELAVAAGFSADQLERCLQSDVRRYLLDLDAGRFLVSRRFKNVDCFETFSPLVTPEPTVIEYTHETYEALISFELLLPLTQEDNLRTALDDLFYRDTVEDLVRDLHDSRQLESAIRRDVEESEESYIERAIQAVAELFGGYSIAHVNGRYRSGAIASYEDAAKLIVDRTRYLTDETTAIVRFVAPLKSTRRLHGVRFDLKEQPGGVDRQLLTTEIESIRALFFGVFVNALVRTIRGERAVWLLEESPAGRKLYTFEK
jgi:hypothetical protein